MCVDPVGVYWIQPSRNPDPTQFLPNILDILILSYPFDPQILQEKFNFRWILNTNGLNIIMEAVPALWIRGWYRILASPARTVCTPIPLISPLSFFVNFQMDIKKNFFSSGFANKSIK